MSSARSRSRSSSFSRGERALPSWAGVNKGAHQEAAAAVVEELWAGEKEEEEEEEEECSGLGKGGSQGVSRGFRLEGRPGGSPEGRS